MCRFHTPGALPSGPYELLWLRVFFNPGYISAMATVLKTWLKVYPGRWPHPFFSRCICKHFRMTVDNKITCTGGRPLCKRLRNRKDWLKFTGLSQMYIFWSLWLKSWISWLFPEEIEKMCWRHLQGLVEVRKQTKKNHFFFFLVGSCRNPQYMRVILPKISPI